MRPAAPTVKHSFFLPLSRSLVLLGLCLGLVGPRPLVAQDASDKDTASTTLKEALQDNRHPFRLEDGEIRGDGAAWLRERAAGATIVTLGESHGTQEIPAVMAALIEDLRQSGTFDHLAIETSPWTTDLMINRLREGKGAYDAFVKQYPAAIPFYTLKTERDLVHQVVHHSENDRPLWGLDQIFAFATSLAFDRLEALAPSAAARSAVQEVRAAGRSRSAEDPRLQNLPPGLPTPLSVYSPAMFDTLRSRFEGIEEAQTLLRELATSVEIYRLNRSDNYRSNQLRARYLRDNLRRHIQHAREASGETPQIVIKIGGRHAYRDRTPNNALDVGNLSVALARAMGGEALNVAVLCGPGSQAMMFPAQPSDCWPDHLGEAFEALAAEQTALFDLTALHPLLHESILTPGGELEKFLWAFDAVVLIPNAQPAQPIVPPADR